MAPVLAGWFAGYVMAMSSTVVLTYLAVRVRPGFVARFFSRELPAPILAVPVSLGNALFWTLVGLVLGAVYDVADLGATESGLGSPSLGFTVAMVSLASAPLVVLTVLWPRQWALWLLASGTFAGSFGWLLPHLAGR